MTFTPALAEPAMPLAQPSASPRAVSACALLRASQVSFAYKNGPVVLNGVDLSVSSGGVTMILGRSGSGKTTLLKLFARLLSPVQGAVDAASLPGGKQPVVAYIPQTLGLVRGRTALKNTLAGALSRTGWWRSLLGHFPSDVVRQAHAILERVGLAAKTHEPVACLSGGERQRVAIARALMMRPNLVLADEFVSQLDAVTTREMLDLMRAQTSEGTGFVVTTHDPEIAAEYADRVLIMRNGRVVFEAEAANVSARMLLDRLEEAHPLDDQRRVERSGQGVD